jgi:hypothetical protein
MTIFIRKEAGKPASPGTTPLVAFSIIKAPLEASDEVINSRGGPHIICQHAKSAIQGALYDPALDRLRDLEVLLRSKYWIGPEYRDQIKDHLERIRAALTPTTEVNYRPDLPDPGIASE